MTNLALAVSGWLTCYTFPMVCVQSITRSELKLIFFFAVLRVAGVVWLKMCSKVELNTQHSS